MGLLDGFEKLINEHGSATILKERIALANDKYAALEQKLAASELRAGNLDSENQKLHAQLNEANKEIARLQEIIQAFAKNKRIENLKDVEKQILQFLVDANKSFTTQQIAVKMKLAEGFAQHYISSLAEKNLVMVVFGIMGPSAYAITPEGRTLIINGS